MYMQASWFAVTKITAETPRRLQNGSWATTVRVEFGDDPAWGRGHLCITIHHDQEQIDWSVSPTQTEIDRRAEQAAQEEQMSQPDPRPMGALERILTTEEPPAVAAKIGPECPF